MKDRGCKKTMGVADLLYVIREFEEDLEKYERGR